jgi:hypothetical protein
MDDRGRVEEFCSWHLKNTKAIGTVPFNTSFFRFHLYLVEIALALERKSPGLSQCIVDFLNVLHPHNHYYIVRLYWGFNNLVEQIMIRGVYCIYIHDFSIQGVRAKTEKI